MSRVRVKKNLLDRFVLATVIWCVFSAKFVLFAFQGTGVRIDDVVILFLFILFILKGFVSLEKVPYQAIPFILYLCVAILSSLYNGAIGRVHTVAALVFSIRSLEYFVFFYVGVYMARRRIELYPIFKYYLLFLLILVPLQMADLVPASSKFSSTRAIGNTYGPYELAVISAFLSYYFYLHTPKSKSMAFMSAVILMATASRTTTLAYLIIFAKRFRARLLIAIPVIAVGVVLVSELGLASSGNEGFGNDDLLSRVSMLFSHNLLVELQASNKYIFPVSTSDEYIRTYYMSAMEEAQHLSVDTSAFLRYYHWIALIKSSFANLDSIFFGLGPSFGTAAVDGFYVRVLIETGVIGLGLYIWFIARCLQNAGKVSLVFKYYIITMLLTACTIDIFFSYKPMMLFWLYLGWLHESAKLDRDKSSVQASTSRSSNCLR